MRIRLLDVRPGERRNAAGAFLTLFGMLAAHTLLETARDTLFLMDLPAGRLPFVYLGIAIVALAFGQLRFRFAGPDGRNQIAGLSVAAAAVTLLFRLLLPHSDTWLLYALYLWSGLIATLLVVRFWTVAAELFTFSQAKRLFPLVGSGSILGAVAGSAVARAIVVGAEPTALLPAAAAAFLLTALAPAILCKPPPEDRVRHLVPEEDRPADSWANLRDIVAHPYLKRIAALMVLSTTTFTVADFVFKSAVASTVSAEQLGWVFATTALIVNVFSLVAQLVLVGWMTRRLAVDRVLTVLPVLLLGAAAWIAAGGGALAAFLLRGVDGTFRHSLQRTANEVLWVPLSSEWRERSKGLIDVIGQRGGQAFASLGLLLAGWLGVTQPVLGAILVALCIAWIAVAIDVKRPYFDVFRRTLDEGSIRTRIEFPELSLSSLESLIAALGSADEKEVRAGLDLLAEKGKLHLVPALILWHPSPRVVVRALELFRAAGRTDHERIVDRLLSHEDPAVRTAALLSTPVDPADRSRFESALSDEAPDVRATALVGLMSCGEEPHPRVRSILDTAVQAGSAEAKRSLARAIGARPGPCFDGILVALVGHPDPEVGCEVARAMRAAPQPMFIDPLISLLGRRATREEARLTLVAIGEPALERCAARLADDSVDVPARRHLPRTIARFDPQEAAQILAARLLAESDGSVRYKILRGLGQCRRRDPAVKLDESTLDESIRVTLARLFELLDQREALERHRQRNPASETPVRVLIRDLLDDKFRLALERLFRLFSLRYPREDFRRLHRGIESGVRTDLASARELLENALPSPVREAVLALLDDGPVPVRLRAGERWYRPADHTPAGLLGALLGRGETIVGCLVAYHAAETGLRELRDDLEALSARASGIAAEAMRAAIERLDHPDREEVSVVPLR
jgi:AAA family ATP:ADP antiporter